MACFCINDIVSVLSCKCQMFIIPTDMLAATITLSSPNHQAIESASAGCYWYIIDWTAARAEACYRKTKWLFAANNIVGRNSSVGRALDWRSKGPWFDPGFRHLKFLFSIFSFRIKEKAISHLFISWNEGYLETLAYDHTSFVFDSIFFIQLMFQTELFFIYFINCQYWIEKEPQQLFNIIKNVTIRIKERVRFIKWRLFGNFNIQLQELSYEIQTIFINILKLHHIRVFWNCSFFRWKLFVSVCIWNISFRYSMYDSWDEMSLNRMTDKASYAL